MDYPDNLSIQLHSVFSRKDNFNDIVRILQIFISV